MQLLQGHLREYNLTTTENREFVALNNKGVSLGKLSNYTGAIQYFDKALAIDPNFAAALVNKGFALSLFKKYQEAIIYFDKALQIDPNNAIALQAKRQLLERTN
jgi:tetratricopeptide (TPR) repeat protein